MKKLTADALYIITEAKKVAPIVALNQHQYKLILIHFVIENFKSL